LGTHLPYQRHQKKVRQQQQKQESSFNFSELKGKPFWIWDKEEHYKLARESIALAAADERGRGSCSPSCCFNHIVGLPIKDKIEHPIFDYEKILYDSLMIPMSVTRTNRITDFKDKHLWVKKATGLGVTEFMLRLMAWLCTTDSRFMNCQMCIVTGPNIDMAIKLIKRMKNIFETKLQINFQDKETVLELNGCRIEAYPSNHIDSFRSLDSPKFILLDEADFFRKGEQEDVRHVSERYIGKSDPYIVMVSTPNAPNGLFEKIEKEPEASCIYKRLKMNYTYGLDKIYAKEEIHALLHD
jgi:hypothetical protein